MFGCLELQLSLGKLTNFIPATDGTMLTGSLLGLSLDSRKSLLTRRKLLVRQISALLRRQIILLQLEHLLLHLDDLALLLLIGACHLLHILKRRHWNRASDTDRRKTFGLLCIEELVESLLISNTSLLLLLFSVLAAARARRQASLFLLELCRLCLGLHVALLFDHGIHDVVAGTRRQHCVL